jgi:hypothetical protein
MVRTEKARWPPGGLAVPPQGAKPVHLPACASTGHATGVPLG